MNFRVLAEFDFAPANDPGNPIRVEPGDIITTEQIGEQWRIDVFMDQYHLIEPE